MRMASFSTARVAKICISRLSPGVSEDLPRDQREKRMQTYEEFMKDVELVRGGSSDRVSEIDLSNPKDLRVVRPGWRAPTMRRP